VRGEPRTDDPIYDPDEDKKYYSGLLNRMQHDAKTLARLALLDNEGPPVTHVNGVPIAEAWKLAEDYGK
jgi:hypothetical protein